MAHIDLHDELELEDALLVEGFPGLGLVGKITVDHLVDTLDMTHFADVHCDALPKAAAFQGECAQLHTPVRLYADTERNLVTLQSDVQVSPDAAYEFAGCVSGWLTETGTTPLYVAGISTDGGDGNGNGNGPSDGNGPDGGPNPLADEETSAIRGVATEPATELLAETDLDAPEMSGIVSGPSGALLAHAMEANLPAIGIVVDTHPKFPDPGAAKLVLEEVVEPLAGVDVAVDDLTEQAERVQQAKEQLAAQLASEDDEKSSKATPLRMYQ
jgi:uncharacterized protein